MYNNKIRDIFYYLKKMEIYDYNLYKDYEGKGLHGDIIEIGENKSYNVIKRITHKIVGTLLLNSKVKYGVYKDKLLYLFKPSIPNYPDFYVASKYENETENKYVYIEFAEWNNYLRGNIIDYIGEVGTKDGEYGHLKYLNKLNEIKELKLMKDKIKNDYEKDKKFQEKCKLENNKSYYQLFSIDPYGCKDIDDAFHFKVLNKEEDLYEVGVHISYTWEYFKEDIKKYFKMFSERISTFYGYNKNINMIPKEYSEDLSSLLEKKYRNVLSIIFIIKNGIVINTHIGLNVGYIVKNYSYDYINNLYKEYINGIRENNQIELRVKEDILIKFMELSKCLFKTNDVEDSHKLVEYWMVYGNCVMGNECVKKFGEKSILRVQNKSVILDNKIEDNELNKFLKIYNGESALYKLYDKDDDNNYHQNIIDFIKEKYYYTHYTSPIRRFCDMYIHGLYTNLYNKDDINNLDNIINHMNCVNKNMRKYQNQSKIIDLLFKYVDKEEYIIDTIGYIIEINVEQNMLKIYFPEFGFILKRYIIDNKFKNIAQIIREENKNKYIIKISNEVEEIYEYEMYKKYDLKIYLFPKKYILHERMIFIF